MNRHRTHRVVAGMATLLFAATLPSPTLSLSAPPDQRPTAAARPRRVPMAQPAPPTVPAAMPPAVEDLDRKVRFRTPIEKLIRPSERHRVTQARYQVELAEQFLDDVTRDPRHDDVRRSVRDSYLRVYRDALEQAFPLDELLSERLRRGRSSGKNGAQASSWRPRIDPKFSASSDGYVGAKLSLPDSPFATLSRLSLQTTYDLGFGGWSVGLKYNWNGRYLQLQSISGNEQTGQQYLLAGRWSFR